MAPAAITCCSGSSASSASDRVKPWSSVSSPSSLATSTGSKVDSSTSSNVALLADGQHDLFGLEVEHHIRGHRLDVDRYGGDQLLEGDLLQGGISLDGNGGVRRSLLRRAGGLPGPSRTRGFDLCGRLVGRGVHRLERGRAGGVFWAGSFSGASSIGADICRARPLVALTAREDASSLEGGVTKNLSDLPGETRACSAHRMSIGAPPRILARNSKLPLMPDTGVVQGFGAALTASTGHPASRSTRWAFPPSSSLPTGERRRSPITMNSASADSAVLIRSSAGS